MSEDRYFCVLVLLIAGCGRSSILYAPAEVPLPPAEIWLRPLVRPSDGRWIPDESVVEAMKGVVDIELRSRLPKARQDRPAGEYWFQYEGRWFDGTQKIFFVGRPEIFLSHALKVVSGASIPESCHVSGLFIPSTKTVADFYVSGFNCPARL